MKKYILLGISLSLLLRMTFFLIVKPWRPDVKNNLILQHDAFEYYKLATNLLEYCWFTSTPLKPKSTHTLWPPLYPLFIAMCGRNISIVLLFQIFIDSFSCLLLFFIIKNLLNRKVGLYGSIFYALNPFFIFYSCTLLSEILFVFLCLLGAYFFSKVIYKKFQKNVEILVSGLFFGLATLTKPILFYLPIIIIFLLILLSKKIKPAIRNILLFGLSFGIIVFIWVCRNFILFNSFSFSTSNSYNLLTLYVVPMEREKRGLSLRETRNALFYEAEQLMIKDNLDPHTLNDFQKAKYWRKLGIQYIKKSPSLFIKHYILGIVHLLCNMNTREYAKFLHLKIGKQRVVLKEDKAIFKKFFTQKSIYEKLIAIPIALYLLLTYSFLFVGVIVGWKKYNKQFLFFSLIMALYFILLTGTAGLVRFKLPSIPFYLIFVGIGIHFIFNRRAKNRL